ncbi:MAG: hypothetical protein J6Q54_00585 [Oscillospiraceae bacterium]|nr:hypothetical protein [Oscillospiraceae bacterium]
MKKVFAILLSVLLVCALAVSAFAAFESSKCVLTTAKTELKRGETFTVTAVLTNSETVNLGTVALTYDADVFELVGGQCLVSGTMLGTVTVPNKAGTFMLNGSSALSGDLFTFELKVKENAPVGAVKLDQKTSIGMGNGTYITAEGLNLNIYCEHVFDQEVVDDKYVATAATCTTLGTYYKSCTCGAKGTETFEAGELAEHKYDEGKVTVEPTPEKDGEKVCTCTVCGAQKTEAVPYLETPATGDNTVLVPMILLAVLSLCGMAVVVVMKKRAA